MRLEEEKRDRSLFALRQQTLEITEESIRVVDIRTQCRNRRKIWWILDEIWWTRNRTGWTRNRIWWTRNKTGRNNNRQSILKTMKSCQVLKSLIISAEVISSSSDCWGWWSLFGRGRWGLLIFSKSSQAARRSSSVNTSSSMCANNESCCRQSTTPCFKRVKTLASKRSSGGTYFGGFSGSYSSTSSL